MNLDEVERRFLEANRARLKPSSRKAYLISFRKFARESAIADLSRRQVAGPRGKQLLLEHLERIPKSSWRTNLTRIKEVWTSGLRLPWPLNSRQDLGRLPKTRRDPTPPSEPVKEWAATLEREKDSYLRLVWLFMAQHGWRPSHATGVRWGDIQYDGQGRPHAILARGDREEFKTYAIVAVRLAPDVAGALEEWRTKHPSPHPDAWILPWRSLTGKVNGEKRMDSDQFRHHWLKLQKKYGLPPLRPKDLRHWVSTVCRKAGLSKAASAHMQGHDPAYGGGMRDVYDNPRLEEIFEEQAERLPNGPLATLKPVEIELAWRSPEALALLDAYISGTIGTMEFMVAIESVRKKCVSSLIV